MGQGAKCTPPLGRPPPRLGRPRSTQHRAARRRAPARGYLPLSTAGMVGRRWGDPRTHVMRSMWRPGWPSRTFGDHRWCSTPPAEYAAVQIARLHLFSLERLVEKVFVQCVLDISAIMNHSASFAYPSQCHLWLFEPITVKTHMRRDTWSLIGSEVRTGCPTCGSQQ